MMNKPLSICVLRLSAIGDVCHTLAAVQAIQRHYPNCKVSWIVGKTEANLIKNIPNIELILFDKKSGWKGIVTLWKQLRTKRYDVLLNMQTAFRASVLSLGIRAKQKIGFNKERAREAQWLFTNAKIEPTTSIHVLDHQMMFAKALGVTDLVPHWNLALEQSDLIFASQFIDKNTKNIVIAPCSSKPEKDWSVEKYSYIAEYLIIQGMNVIIVGSPSSYEVETASKIQELVPKCNNIAGKTQLTQLAAIISQSDLVLSSDSASAHIATTQNTPVIGLYAIHNPRRTGPYNDLDKVVSVYDEAILQSYGKPWQELPWATKAKGENLMDKITVTQVEQKLIETLDIK
ncbi:glycosyltransferase family 9 protein [Pasteurella skyensis]|uniref:Glycosyltransferase family 9 protein n=2 Tax=Phocoenobacter skyensis TaxID=97481 RepID=A0AAJ6N7W8_9PAST|nr:glycosyltransferase family 9 protein [Pasteurella skyensis]MDP8161681.1 glycosyltransferase family 9 protein [Pasteurella skyensis]MDP8171837.1 glycosyltransferase family 9 protein [Pasteurella skyensis]MDP8176074.1 glycosyltransferase family 9 protein [Pasteurella skyensis]MDP8178092.1 glycosyltransferase family 9 protein [Pasteurella skyensis]MDP8182300.1 glycosyltransferase family 9 protein [Pasteurella skyensis]